MGLVEAQTQNIWYRAREIRIAALYVLESRFSLWVTGMVEEQSKTGDVGRGLSLALLMQEFWKQEVEEAIEKFKREVPVIKRKARRKKPGFWTPTGFAWYRRRKKRHNYKRWYKNESTRY